MSISDGLLLSISCQKVGKTLPFEVRSGWKCFCFRPELAFSLYCSNIGRIFLNSTLRWRVNKYFFRQGFLNIWEMIIPQEILEDTDGIKLFYVFCGTDYFEYFFP